MFGVQPDSQERMRLSQRGEICKLHSYIFGYVIFGQPLSNGGQSSLLDILGAVQKLRIQKRRNEIYTFLRVG